LGNVRAGQMAAELARLLLKADEAETAGLQRRYP